jgi:hypothetical protein
MRWEKTGQDSARTRKCSHHSVLGWSRSKTHTGHYENRSVSEGKDKKKKEKKKKRKRKQQFK